MDRSRKTEVRSWKQEALENKNMAIDKFIHTRIKSKNPVLFAN